MLKQNLYCFKQNIMTSRFYFFVVNVNPHKDRKNKNETNYVYIILKKWRQINKLIEENLLYRRNFEGMTITVLNIW